MPAVAIVGTSRDPEKYGNKAVRAYRSQGWTVYPIHPTEREIEGLAVRASVRDLPSGLDRITLYVPPAIGIRLLDDIVTARAVAQPGIRECRVSDGCSRARSGADPGMPDRGDRCSPGCALGHRQKARLSGPFISELR